MSIVLDALYLLVLLACSPALVYRSWKTGRYRQGWAEKVLGKAPWRIGEGPCIWFHAVSVGEVMLLRPLVAEIERRRPGWQVVVSTTTQTGLAVARKTFPDLVTFYAPMDFSWATRRAMSRVNPTVLALVELEIWPNLVAAAKEQGARVAIINGRLSRRSHAGYRRIRVPLASTLRRIDAVAAQSQGYADRFVDLGVPDERVRVTGSVKYDGLESDRGNARTRALRQQLGLAPTDLIFVAGSTMEGEEEAALAAYLEARTLHPRLRLVLVPRHPERFDRVASMVERSGERVLRRTDIEPVACVGGAPPVLLVDTVGELAAVWGLADVAFVGGSLKPGRGGQNMMEPAAYGSAVLFGRYTANFRETVEHLLSVGGARAVADGRELTEALVDALEDPESAADRGAAARKFVLAQEGATSRTLGTLDRLVGPVMAEITA
ncbi:3-deoxy-D-manno-octulosonic acid transferase [Isosphaeraceae bacterium EP7]